MGVRIVDVNKVASEIVDVLERNNLPVGYLGEVLDKVEETVLYFTPIKLGQIGRKVREDNHGTC